VTARARRPAVAPVISQLAAFVASRAMLLGATIVVARVAGAAAYGSLAIGLVVLQAGIFIRDAGLGQGLVIVGQRRAGLTWPTFLAATSIGVVLAVVIISLADPLTNILGVPEAAEIVRLLGLAFGIGSAGVASSAALERTLRFVSRAWVDVAAYGALTVVTIALLASGFGAASLAWGYVAHAAVQTSLAVILSPPWADAGAPLRDVVALARYSGTLWVAAVLSYLAANLDNALVGRLGGAEALGIYALAYTIGNTVTIGFVQVVNRVALPYYGRASGEPGAARTLLKTVTLTSISFAALSAAVIAFLAPEISRSLFDTSIAIGPLIVLAGYGIVRAAGIVVGTALNGLGEARRTVASGAVNVACIALTLPAAFQVAGLTGAGAAVLAALALSIVVLLPSLSQRSGANPWRLLWPAALALLAGLVIAALMVESALVLRLAVIVLIGSAAAAVAIRGARGLFETAPSSADPE